MALIEKWYNFTNTPYYELEFFIDENRRIGTEIIKMNGQTVIKSKSYPGKSFYIPKSYNPDILGNKRRVKFYVENMFPRVDPGTYAPSDDYEVLVEVPRTDNEGNQEKDELGQPVIDYVAARSDFWNKIVETKIGEEILAEPIDKWEKLMPILYIACALAGVYILFAVIIPGMH